MYNANAIDEENDELLENPNHTFTFKSSTHALSNGRYWCPFVIPTIAGIIFTITMISLPNPPNDNRIPAIETIAGLCTCIFIFLLIGSYPWPKYYTITFNNDTNKIEIYSKRLFKTTLIGDTDYNIFDKLYVEEITSTYWYFYYFGIFCKCGYKNYKGYIVYVTLKYSNGNYKRYRLNEYALTQNEGIYAMCIIDNINNYYQNYMKTKLLKTVIKYKPLKIGEYCCVDSDLVYYGKIIDYIDLGTYRIIDLFNQKERIVNRENITLIQDHEIKKEVEEKYNQYLLNYNPTLSRVI
eukprot:188581_1